MSLREATMRGLAWSTFEKWGRQGVAFFVFMLLAWLLEPDHLGLAALAAVYIGFVELLVLQGFISTIVQRSDLAPEHLDCVFWFSNSIAAGLMLVTIVAADPIAAALREERAAAVLRALAPSLLMAGMSVVPTALLMRSMNFRPLAIRTLASTLVGGLAAIAVAAAGGGVWAMVTLQLVSTAVALVCLWMATSWRPRMRFSWPHLRALLPISGSLLGSALIWFVSARADQAIVGAALGSTLLGPYAFASRVLQLVRDTLVAPLSSVALPALAKVQNDEPRLMRGYYRMTEWALALGLPVVTGLALLADAVIPLIFGQKWQEAIPVLQILSLTVMLHLAFIGTHPLTLARGKAAAFMGLNAMHAATVVLAVWLTTRFGIIGVSWALAGCWAFNCLFWLVALRQLLGVRLRELGRAWLAPTLAAGAMSLAVCGLGHFVREAWHPVLWIAVSSMVGASIYGSLMAFLRPEMWREICDGVSQRLRWRAAAAPSARAPEVTQT